MATVEAKESDIRDDVTLEARGHEKTLEKSSTLSNGKHCLKATFVVLGIISVIAALALIVLAVLTSMATKAYDAEQTSRMVSMVLLAVSAAATVCVVIYGEVAVFKKQRNPVHIAAVVLAILIIVQALIAGISVNVEPSDEAKLQKSLAESFKLAKDGNPRHSKMWSMTQSDLDCCGVYGPEDYRSSKLPYYFPPDVPIACCPSYDPSRSDLVQERDRELCKVKKTYYNGGCKDLVLLVFKETSSMVLTVDIILMVVEIILMIVGAILCSKQWIHKVEPSK
ncbi:23 kDa integral membrane protein-like [Trichoplusia ni]|uniref:23 kDa integral membrane protein-like n=1 Tax=Trichoplusia ni TaxID=7111 RepID=A0A7E5WRH7_TRINI|nr:23 kDa integral membrane protein-like [Trichoplusia ni]XP_026742761.1 23 kDa integral membrane protein-like [Trichoplusia ni]